MKKIFAALLALVIATPASAWFAEPTPSSDKAMAQKAEAQQRQVDQTVGFPSVVNGFEKRMVRMLYEKRDDPNYRTYSYIVTMTGDFVKICDSVGFGINASIQFSNSEKVVSAGRYRENGYMTLPQAEPNGLYMPEGLAATYVLCVDEEKEELVPVYIEPEIAVSPFPLK
ncbi:hypothetical protein MHM88_14195 [Epibacterium sp. MM17-32]|uniref:hypothetical protein n=1 Tax=Epibacterium sp. MM17-32 TaxID=2917734 RepID=UPI001EF5B03E|nr:hypothetical protein [Epibacterium sp. MM17-32]MCG7628958.1 hypothetical protein [Epibacterium sp. MM17-32]